MYMRLSEETIRWILDLIVLLHSTVTIFESENQKRGNQKK